MLHVFIILQYKNLEDTIECVNSIENKYFRENYRIIIVDNFSNDGSVERIKSIYCNNNYIEVLESKKNLGYANGNNLGAKYAVSSYSPDFLIVINNDTLMEDFEFLKKIENKFKEKEFHILGPYITGRDGIPQNPYTNVVIGKRNILKAIFKLKIYIYLELFNLNFLRKIFRSKKIKKYNYNLEKENVPLMGAALIFSKKYLKMFENIFYPETFMYCEEDILYYIVQKYKLKTIYVPQIKIYHKEESTTNKLNKTTKEQKLFKLTNQINSLKKFYKLIRK